MMIAIFALCCVTGYFISIPVRRTLSALNII